MYAIYCPFGMYIQIHSAIFLLYIIWITSLVSYDLIHYKFPLLSIQLAIIVSLSIFDLFIQHNITMINNTR